MTLFKSTMKLIKKIDRPIDEICKKVKVSQRWYYLLLKGELKNPSVHRIQRIHDYLSKL